MSFPTLFRRSGNDVGRINKVTLRRTRGPTGMGGRLQAGKSLRYVTSHPGQLSLLPSAGREMSTDQSAVTLCGWEVKAGIWLIPFDYQNCSVLCCVRRLSTRTHTHASSS